ncbi:hypothetical protein Q4S57_12400 [Priestia megaterium]|uniref:hypothetical protein n=1 Tax=Priestia megaterium TaxID=1404 RepID=UPI0026E3EC2E|nr:hypothetical protein [Priestia megaterium]MDO6848753.1 hypothetical protein [Priestia megaterium]
MAIIHELIEQAEAECLDEKAKRVGFIVALSGTLYTCSLSRHSAVYIKKNEIEWELWRETHLPGKRDLISFRTIASSKDFKFILRKAENYMKYIQKKKARDL